MEFTLSEPQNASSSVRSRLSALWHHLLDRLEELSGTPQSIAAGFACGVAVSFTPFLGFHCILAAIMAWFIRGNVLAAAIGTVAGNPWTFPFIWISVLYTGRLILGGAYAQSTQVDFLHFFEKSTHALLSFDFSAFLTDIWPVLWPMMVGSIPFVVVVWFITYYLLKTALTKFGTKKLQQLENKADKLRTKKQ